MCFEFSPTPKIIFGRGAISKVPNLAKSLGTNIFLTIGLSSGPKDAFIQSLRNSGLHISIFQICREPTVSDIELGLASALKENCDIIIGLGGGSAIDSGKTIAAMVTNTGGLLEYLEVAGRGKPLVHPPLPYIAIPTTAGTGAEVTQNAVIGLPEHKIKVSLRGIQLVPKIAVIDPELTYSLPSDVTARTGMDALTQLIEPFVSKYSNPMTDIYCREGMNRISRSLIRAYQDNDLQAREDLSIASMFSGLALSNAKLGAVHGFAGPLGGMFDAPHGAICAALLPYVVKTNINVLQNRAEDYLYLNRFTEIARILTQNPSAEINDTVTWLNSLKQKLEIPPLSKYGLTTDDFPIIIEKASHSSSMRGNPVELTDAEMYEILFQSL